MIIIGIALLVKLIEGYAVDANTILTKAGINPSMLVAPKVVVFFSKKSLFLALKTWQVKYDK
ncbi:hypothetical protein A9Q74_09835 [Colwellia sp. 39_35_sub15_T18]|nr:hypothetical protein A9Q74_09835 [Colwellia sp. 39_35_sub15_T18]